MHVRHESRKIKAGLLDLPAILRRFIDLLAVVARIDHEFLRHAAADHACATNTVLLGNRHFRTRLGSDPGCAHPARAGSNDKEIIIVLRIGHSGRPSGAVVVVAPLHGP